MRSAIAQRYPLLFELATSRLGATLAALSLLFVLSAYGEYARLLAGADGLLTRHGKLIGGDFVVFRTAATLAGTDAMVPMYRMDYFASQLRAAYPGAGSMLLGWQYPPTMLLLVTPLALLPFLSGFWFWIGAQAALLARVLWVIWADRRLLWFSLASPAVFQTVITGQTGMLTSSLLGLSAWFARSQPVVAGIAAGILTVKPQFGVLIPLAFAAGRCWRAFFVAAATGTTLVGVSLLAYGPHPWLAFVDAVRSHGGRLVTEGFPLEKLVTPFGAMRIAGAGIDAATTGQTMLSLLLALYVVVSWKRIDNVNLRVAALMPAALLANPYAFYYELPVLILPVALVVREAMTTGWLRFERLSVVLLWIASFLPPGAGTAPSLPVSFLVALAAFLICLRRVLPAMIKGDGVTLTQHA